MLGLSDSTVNFIPWMIGNKVHMGGDFRIFFVAEKLNILGSLGLSVSYWSSQAFSKRAMNIDVDITYVFQAKNRLEITS